jgi:uncharacterized protein (TIGR02271 family)
MAQTVIGVFDTQGDAQRAVEQLFDNGFDRDSVDISAQTDTDYSTQTTTMRDRDDDNDGIGGFFRSLFGGDDDDEREKYTNVARRGTLVTVYARSNDEAERAADLLDEYGAVNVDERYEQYRTQPGYTSEMGTTPTDAGYLNTNQTNEQGGSVQVIEENLNVGKREVTTGGVRVRSRIVERPVEEHIRLREEHVRIERTPVNRPVTDADLNTFQEGQIEVVEHAEVPVVEKQARVVEEISVGKEVNERDETIRDTVRNTEVDVEQIPGTETTQTRRTTNDDL